MNRSNDCGFMSKPAIAIQLTYRLDNFRHCVEYSRRLVTTWRRLNLSRKFLRKTSCSRQYFQQS